MRWGSTAGPAGRRSQRCPEPCGSAWRSSSPRDRLPRPPRPARHPPACRLPQSHGSPRRAHGRARSAGLRRAGAAVRGVATAPALGAEARGGRQLDRCAAARPRYRLARRALRLEGPADVDELGLLGAGVLARERANLLRDTVVVNFDGLDDRGATIVLVHRPGPIVDRLVAALDARRRRAWPVIVDGIAFARAARECMTIMRGDWGTARVVHTPRDTADRLTLEGSRQVADRVAGVLAQMFPS